MNLPGEPDSGGQGEFIHPASRIAGLSFSHVGVWSPAEWERAPSHSLGDTGWSLERAGKAS